jgi:hypothetical protein
MAAGMRAYTWQQRLDLAENEEEVIQVARDFLAALHHSDVARLPDPCKPRKLLTATDIGNYAFELARLDYEEMQGIAQLVHRLAAFFVSANIRLSQILAKTNDDDGEAQQSA